MNQRYPYHSGDYVDDFGRRWRRVQDWLEPDEVRSFLREGVDDLFRLLLGHADGVGFGVPPEHRDGSHAAIRWLWANLRAAQQRDELVEWTPVWERVAAWVRRLRGV